MNQSSKHLVKQLEGIDSVSAAALLSQSADTVFVLDQNGVIDDILNTEAPGLNHLKSLVGKSLHQSVASDSLNKVKDLLNPNPPADTQKWRQINLPTNEGNLPIMVSTIHLPKDQKILAVGRDLRNIAKLQQRLVEAQQAVESDYLKLRFAEARYRQLFELSNNAHIIIDGSSLKILEANSIAQNLISEKNKRVIGKPIAEFVDVGDFALLQDTLNSARNKNVPKKIELALTKESNKVIFSASFLREENQTAFLINLIPVNPSSQPESEANSESLKLQNAMEFSPDGFVITNIQGRIITANKTSLEMLGVEKLSDVVDESLDNWLGRGNIDLRIILNNLKDRNSIKHYATTFVGGQGNIDIEINAVNVPSEKEPMIGFSIRAIGGRISARNEPSDDLQQSATKLTELVGKVPLREIVNETTDLIEKLCILSALDLTMNNRVSASEMLGVSRQSLYIKMRRFGIMDSSLADEN